jgi:hypothetical protein
MSDKRSIVPLILGVALVLIGGLFLVVNTIGITVGWLQLLRFVVPLLLLALGVTKLIRHWWWDEARLQMHPRKASLLGGLFWTSLGILTLLSVLGVLDWLSFFGSYWPALLILFGIGKIIDFYRLPSGFHFRPGEIIGVVAVILLGVAANRLATLPGVTALSDLREGRWPFVLIDEPRSRARVESREEIAAAGVRVVQIDNQFGDIEVENGLEDQVEVSLMTVGTGESEERARDFASRVQLSLQKEGETVKVGTDRAQLELERNYRLTTHLKMLVPQNIEVRINNQNGRVNVARIRAPIKVNNSYGAIKVESVIGRVEARNRYEHVTLNNIEGEVAVENRRGDVRLNDIRGNAVVTTDYGSVNADGVRGQLDVSNHFGDVRLRAVDGPVNIKSPGSRVDLANISKAVLIENSHKGVRIAGLSNSLELNTSYSKVDVSRVEGAVTIRASHSEIAVRDLNQGVSVEGSGSKVNLSQVEGPIKIATSLQRVALDKFRGPAEVQNEYGEIVLRPDVPLIGSLVASNRNGEITLTLPESASCKLSAQAPGGEVVSEFAAEAMREKSQVFEQTLGGGKSEVRLQTTYSRIRIRKSG